MPSLGPVVARQATGSAGWGMYCANSLPQNLAAQSTVNTARPAAALQDFSVVGAQLPPQVCHSSHASHGLVGQGNSRGPGARARCFSRRASVAAQRVPPRRQRAARPSVVVLSTTWRMMGCPCIQDRGINLISGRCSCCISRPTMRTNGMTRRRKWRPTPSRHLLRKTPWSNVARPSGCTAWCRARALVPMAFMAPCTRAMSSAAHFLHTTCFSSPPASRPGCRGRWSADLRRWLSSHQRRWS